MAGIGIALSVASTSGAAASSKPSTTSQSTVTTTSQPSAVDLGPGASRVQQIESVLAAQQQQSEALSQAYDATLQRHQLVELAIAASAAKLAGIESQLHAARRMLRREAVAAYVLGAPSSTAIKLFGNGGNSDARSEYLVTAMGDIQATLGGLELQQLAAASVLSQQHSLERQAHHELASARHLLVADQRATTSARADLVAAQGPLKDQMLFIAIETAKNDAAQGDASGAAAAIDVADLVGGPTAAAAAIAAANATGGLPTAGVADATPSQLLVTQAAISQVGTPYIFGAETPGTGFDCSGLVQWAWAQAGRFVPRTAQQQYDTLPHISLTQLEPGDLLFYFNLDGDHVVDHVVIYLGQGPYGSSTVIAASHSGALVDFEPLFSQGLIGAARP